MRMYATLNLFFTAGLQPFAFTETNMATRNQLQFPLSQFELSKHFSNLPKSDIKARHLTPTSGTSTTVRLTWIFDQSLRWPIYSSPFIEKQSLLFERTSSASFLL